MKSILEQNFSKIMDIKKCLERVKAIEKAMKYLQMNIFPIYSDSEVAKIGERLTSNGWEKQL